MINAIVTEPVEIDQSEQPLRGGLDIRYKGPRGCTEEEINRNYPNSPEIRRMARWMCSHPETYFPNVGEAKFWFPKPSCNCPNEEKDRKRRLKRSKYAKLSTKKQKVLKKWFGIDVDAWTKKRESDKTYSEKGIPTPPQDFEELNKCRCPPKFQIRGLTNKTDKTIPANTTVMRIPLNEFVRT